MTLSTIGKAVPICNYARQHLRCNPVSQTLSCISEEWAIDTFFRPEENWLHSMSSGPAHTNITTYCSVMASTGINIRKKSYQHRFTGPQILGTECSSIPSASSLGGLSPSL